MFGLDIKDKKDPKRIDREKVLRLLEKLGVASKPVEAEYVEIKTADRIIRVKNPDVLLTFLFGRDVYQVTGEVEEVPLRISEAELKKIMRQTGKDRQEVVAKLAELNYDVTKAVSELKGIARRQRKGANKRL